MSLYGTLIFFSDCSSCSSEPSIKFHMQLGVMDSWMRGGREAGRQRREERQAGRMAERQGRGGRQGKTIRSVPLELW